MMNRRSSGILLHVTSLPSKYGIGDLGPEAYRFADFLMETGQRYWQVLALSPIGPHGRYSPYNGLSGFAANTCLISPELLYRRGLLRKNEIRVAEFPDGSRIDYRRVLARKRKLLDAAFKRFRNTPDRDDYERFCSANTGWLDDYAVFVALSRRFGTRMWCRWPLAHRRHRAEVVRSAAKELRTAIDHQKFLQFIFFRQWQSLRRYCNNRRIRMIGDVPFYVAYDSADVWARQDMFCLTASGKPAFISGVPPDAFSRTGQLWGNPVYDWSALRKTGYSWWIDRISHNLDMFDFVRIDHFRGFVAFWRVPAGRKTAQSGRWVRGPGGALFDALRGRGLCKRLIAEDLGYITDAVRNLLERYSLTCMRVMQFAFGPDQAQSCHSLRNHPADCVVYTGTHDNNTARGWFKNETTAADRKRLSLAAGRTVTKANVNWELILLAMSSRANTVIIPMQDVLGLGVEARMNHPGRSDGNWRWKLRKDWFRSAPAERLAESAAAAGRIED